MCVSPLLAWQRDNGEVVFTERGAIYRELQLPCGQCIECRLERSRQWALRCMHENMLHKESVFATLTYDDDHLPADRSLDYRHFQLFMKRLRKAYGDPVRFYMCGEYGDQLARPHYHALLFGLRLDDKAYWKKGESGSDVFTSEWLRRLWGFGDCFVGDVTFQSAGYVARYCVQKITGYNAKYYYGDLQPEFNKMSLKPGIGSDFYRKFRTDIYPHDYVVHNGQKMRPPKLYDRMYKEEFPDEYEEMQFKRELDGRSKWADQTPDRLAVREEVLKAKVRNLKRSGDA